MTKKRFKSKPLSFIPLLFIAMTLLSCLDKSVSPTDNNTIDEFQKKGSIAGKVSDLTTTNGISGVAVTTDSAGFTTTTDSLGNYRIPNVSAGKYTLTFSKANYIDTTIANVTIAIDEDKNGVNMFIRSAYGKLSGTVRDTLKQIALANIAVILQPTGTTTATDSTGAFTFSPVRQGSYSLSFSNDAYTEKQILDIKVTGGITTTLQATYLHQKFGSISGMVTDTAGNPLAEIAVQIDSLHKDLTGADGKYLIQKILPGTYVVTFSGSSFATITNSLILDSAIDSSITAIPLTYLKSSISGIVTNKSGDPVSGVAVSIQGVAEATTLADGTYTLGNLLAGTYKISFIHNDYDAHTKDSVTLRADQYLKSVNVTLTSKYGTVHGRVTDSVALPIEGVTVRINESLFTTTSPDGSYLISGVPAGAYQLFFSHPLYASRLKDSVIIIHDTTTVLDEITLVYLKSSISGIITDLHGKLLSGVNVTIAGVADVTSIADGSYTLANILSGTYNISFSHGDFLPTSITNVTLSANEHKNGINGQMTYKYGWITGTITDSLLNQLEGVTVSADQTHSTTTNANGLYILSNLNAGKYKLTFSHNQYSLANSDSVTVTSDDTTNDINARLSILRTSISGVVADSITGELLTGVSVTIDGIANTTTIENGTYTLGNVMPGTYTITFSAAGFVSRSNAGVTIAANQHIQNNNVNLLPMYSSISGKVTDTSGNALAGVLVIADATHQIITSNNGSFTINNLRGGKYKLSFSSSQFHPFSTDTITISAGQDTTLTTVALSYMRSSIQGVITDLHGKLLSGVNVTIAGVADATSIADGSYTLANILPGSYNISLSHGDYLPTSVSNVVLTADEHKTGVDAQMIYKCGWIKGTVTDSLINPLAGVTVSTDQTHSTTTNETGLYTLSSLSAGKYKLSFSHNDYVSVNSDSIAVNSDDTVKNVNALLNFKRGSIAGIVTDSISDGLLNGVSVTTGTADVTTISDGSYLIGNLFPGTYNIEFQRSGYISRTISSVVLAPGQQLTSRNIKLLPAPAAKQVSGLVSGAFDSVALIVGTICGDNIADSSQWRDTLEWNATYKSVSGTTYVPGFGSIWKLKVQIFNTSGLMISYREKTFTNTTTNIDIGTMDAENAKPRAIAGNDTTLGIKDTAQLRGNAIDSLNLNGIIPNINSKTNITKWEWNINGTGFHNVTNGDTNIVAPSVANGNYRCVLRVTDRDSNMTCDTMNITVQTRAPSANAGADTIVGIKDAINLHGIGTDETAILKYEWKIGGNNWITTSSRDTNIIAPATAQAYVCSIRVTDDDGNVSIPDEKIITVETRAPIANAGTDTAVGRQDIIHLRGSGSTDLYGHIVKYEWKINNTGDFIKVTSGDTNIIAPNQLFYNDTCILRVTDDDGLVSYDSVKVLVGDFRLATNNAGFTDRNGHTTVVFHDSLWVIGGRDQSGSNNNEIWASADGIIWTQKTSAAAFSPRSGHTTVVYHDSLWVIAGSGPGGYWNDVWASADGITWTQKTLSAGFTTRSFHTTVVFDSLLWVIGGYAPGGSKSDVWSSADGITWSQKTAAAAFSARFWHTSVMFHDSLWVIGGYSGCSDVWASADGITWTQKTAAAAFSVRYGHTSVVYDNLLWVIGGSSGGGSKNDVWTSADGISWTQKTATAMFSGRLLLTSVVYDNSIWVLGGDGPNKFDVWYTK